MSSKLEAACAQARASSETSDAYRHVVALSGRWRIIRCRDDIQYIIQHRQAGSAIYPWRATAYVPRDIALPVVLERFSLPDGDRTSLLADLRLALSGGRGIGTRTGAQA